MSHVKLGLFAILAVVAAIATALGLGIHALRTASIEYHTYFDESVQGLELGSPVKYRGVRIGRVARIAIAPDRKHVDVVLALVTEQAEQLGLAERQPELRAQLGSQGITGVKFVDLDFFDPAANPPPRLSFEPARRYVPARPSLMKGLVDNLEAIGPRLPPLVDRLDGVLAKLSAVGDELADEQLARRIGTAVDSAAALATDARQLVHRIDAARLGDKGTVALERAALAADHFSALVSRLDGIPGLVTSARRAADTVGDLGRTTRGSRDELDETLRELADAARSVRELADDIQREPDILVKGRARSGKP